MKTSISQVSKLDTNLGTRVPSWSGRGSHPSSGRLRTARRAGALHIGAGHIRRWLLSSSFTVVSETRKKRGRARRGLLDKNGGPLVNPRVPEPRAPEHPRTPGPEPPTVPPTPCPGPSLTSVSRGAFNFK